jgi:predicted PurR-regulated permease PerM
MKYPTRFQQRTVWSALTGLAILTLGSLLVGLVWLIGQVFGFLQPVLVPLIVAGIIAYLLDPVVRLIEKRGLSRLWSVIGVYIGILMVTTLLVVAVLPAIQGGKNFFRKMIGASVPTRVVNTDGGDDSSVEEPNLLPALAHSLYHLRNKHQHGPVGWILTEIDDKGEAVPIDTSAEAPDNLKFFWQTRGGKILYDHKADLLELGNRWLSVGSSKVLGLLGLVLGMIMVPVYLFFFLKDSVSIREHWHDYMPLRASYFKTELVETLQEING